MTVRIFKSELVVEAAAKKKPQDYVWYKITKGKVLLDSVDKNFEVELSRGEKFGLKATKTAIYMLDADNFDVHFKLSPSDLRDLLKNASGFSGKIDGVDVIAGSTNTPPGTGSEDGIEEAKGILAALSKLNYQANRARYDYMAKDQKALADIATHAGLYLAQQSVRLTAKQLDALNVVGVNLEKAKAPATLRINPDVMDDAIAKVHERITKFKDAKAKAPTRIRNSTPKAASHPGLVVKQGAVPKQDKAGEAAKRITDKNILATLKKLGVTPEKSDQPGRALTTFVDTATLKKIKTAFEASGWNLDLRNGGSVTSRRGAGNRFKVLYFELPGAKRFMTVNTTGSSKGLLTVRNTK